MEPTTKLSFSLSSKPNPNNNNKRVPSSSTFSLQETGPSSHEQQQQQFVTEFDPSKPPTLINNNTLVIPRLENTWNPYKKMKNIDTPLQNIQDPNLTFELETTPALNMDTDPSMSYGLNIRDKNIKEEEEERGVVSGGGYNPVENVLLKKFKEDMKNLPDDRGMDEFEDVPVEGFGVAILKGYGWKEGQGIGKNAKEDVQVVQYVRRGNKEGLGFQPDKLTFDKKGREQKQLVAPKGENGKTRHVIGIDEKLVVRELKGVHVGKVVRVVSGRHVGLKGKVLDKVDSKVVLKLSSNEEVTVGVQEVLGVGYC
ncbi:hypothetical protein IFM89_022878 [Coptis chinensis]|uniref:G-patch domain-containing protein n=1 Tax=Coptis chinensis TaxID=261450 RepID=A0A835LSH0_9MAGN|nr:hypothetical protein IFM89_022878 [Coptis chinensis]